MSHLTQWSETLALGAARLPEDLRQRHALWLARMQGADGGFPNRAGNSEVYYTGMALAGLALLRTLDTSIARRAADFLRSQERYSISGAEVLALVFGASLLERVLGMSVWDRGRAGWVEYVGRVCEMLRRPDAAYAKSIDNPHSSTYQTFLVLACRDVVGLEPEEPGRLAEAVRSRQREDGGFSELAALRRSGTNPTAAALGALRILGALDFQTADAAAGFIEGMQNAEGGLRAHARIPVADLLSTFTGVFVLSALDRLPRLDLHAVRRYVESLERGSGGFRGAVWDDTADVEYTLYGLGTLALLEGLKAAGRAG